jgi:hypothetical protein
MTAELLPVEGLYETRDDGERAARAVTEGGLGNASVRPLAEVNLALLPTSLDETQRRMVRSLLAIPVGFVVCAPPGFAIGLILAPLVAVFGGLLCGAVGAVLAFLLMDRAPERYRELAQHDGVLLTVSCERAACGEVVQILRDSHPAELFTPHSR